APPQSEPNAGANPRPACPGRRVVRCDAEPGIGRVSAAAQRLALGRSARPPVTVFAPRAEKTTRGIRLSPATDVHAAGRLAWLAGRAGAPAVAVVRAPDRRGPNARTRASTPLGGPGEGKKAAAAAGVAN